MKKITIIGSGFAGLTAVKTLRKQDKNCHITLISPKAELIYLPSLIWIPSGAVKVKDIIISLKKFFMRMQVKHIADEVISIEDDGRVVLTKNGSYKNDALMIASGGSFIKKLNGIEHAITPCEGIKAVEQIRDKLQTLQSGTIAVGFSSNPKEPNAMRGGPMFEFLFGIDTQLQAENRRDKFKLIFFTPAKKPGARLGEKAVKGILAEMKKRNITTHLGFKVKAFEKNKVITEGGEFEADLILFMPGMTGNKYLHKSKLKLSEGGLVKADKFCQTSLKNVFVAGDSGSFPGPEWMPKQAHMADLQAKAAAKNILNSLEGKSVNYTFKVELMCIIDSNKKGIFVARSLKSGLILPSCYIMHLIKKLFSWWYLRQYR